MDKNSGAVIQLARGGNQLVRVNTPRIHFKATNQHAYFRYKGPDYSEHTKKALDISACVVTKK